MADDAAHRVRVAARAGSRVIHADGTTWVVYERHRAYDRRSRPDLVFESEGKVRRVRDYPTNWRDLPDGDLFAVSWMR